MAVAWAHQDCSKPLDQSEQRAKKVRELHAQVADLENKLRAKEEELKNNEIELVAQSEKYEKVQDELGLLKGELAQLHADKRSLQTQLNEAKEEVGIAVAKAVSEYQSLAKMPALRQTIWDEAFEEVMEYSSLLRQFSTQIGTFPIWVIIWPLKLRSGVPNS